MPSLSTYSVFLATAIVLLLIPGPAVLYVVTRSIEMGRAGGLASVAGITTGTVAYVTLAAVGLSSLILASTAAFDAVKYVGAAYLFVLGVRRLLGRGLESADEEARAANPPARLRAGCRSSTSRTRRRSFSSSRSCRSSSTRNAQRRLAAGARARAQLRAARLPQRQHVGPRRRDGRRPPARLDGIARVQRWVGGSVLVGLGILAAVWTPSRAR